MKKYVIILAAAVLGLVSSCNDKLDLTTDGRISRGEIFQDRYKIMGWLNGCYNYCPGVSLTRAGYTDETHHSDAGTSNGQNYYNFYQGSTSSSNWYGPDNPWESLFQGIRKCNIFITGMQVNTLPGNVTQKDKEQWMGEALYDACAVLLAAGQALRRRPDHQGGVGRRSRLLVRPSRHVQRVRGIHHRGLVARRSSPRPALSRGRPIRVITT